MSVEFDEVWKRFGVPVVAPAPIDKVGVALDTLHLAPLNGLRHQPEAGTCGWFIWGGQEPSADPEFFQPVHVGHLVARCPAALPYLGLPPGYRFLLAPGQEDAWFDASLLSS